MMTIFNESGKGYWMEGFGCIRAEGENRPSRPGHIVYAIEGNVVDRVSKKNGKGWCEDVSPTLNTQDKHAVCYAIDQQAGKGNCGYAKDIMMTPFSDSHGTPHAVCYDCRGNGNGYIVNTLPGDHMNRVTDYTPIICYAVDSHPMDSRMRIVDGACPSVTAKLASDGPLILIRRQEDA